MNIECWHALLNRFGIPPESETFSMLKAAYSEKHRAYHTTRHIDECLGLADEFGPLARQPEEVKLALWFHDAIYESMSSSNEERSAEWAARFMREAGLPRESIDRVRSHIQATRHVAESAEPDSQLVVDIDLAILGADRARYEEFERDVRIEYRWVPGILYRSKRAEILKSFLDRPRIYQWEPLHQRFERSARENVAWAIRALRGGP